MPDARLALIDGGGLFASAEDGLQAIAAFMRDLPGSKEAEGGERSRGSAAPSCLTGREVEVLRLIAQGVSNREIAEELVLSLRTVERHITNVYAKIGARGRADATAYALRNSLT